MKVDYTQRYDGEGFEIPSNEVYLMACCDCGLVHDFVFVSGDGGPIGVAAQRNEAETEKRRASTGPAMMPEGQIRQLVSRYKGRVMGGSSRHRAALRLLINEVYAQAFRAGRTQPLAADAQENEGAVNG